MRLVLSRQLREEQS